MRVLTVGTSPLQVQNAIQYITQHGIAFFSCVLAHVGSSNEDDNARSLTIAADHGWGGIEQFPPYRPFKPDDFETRENWVVAEIANRQAFIDLLKDFFTRVGTDFDIVLMGDYRPMSFRQFLQFIADPQPEVVLLDDGAVSRYVMEFRDTGAAGGEVTRGILPNLGENDPFRVMESASLTYFTIYNETVAQSDRLVANMRYQNTNPDAFTMLAGEVWVCGVNHVEARLAKQDELMAMCRKVRSWFPDAKIVYFPHRRETLEKVDLICRSIGATASEYRFGIEEYVFQIRCKPEHLVVFGSTVADTLSRLLAPATRVLVVVPEEKYFTKAQRTDHVRNVIVDNVRKNRFVSAVGAEVENAREWISARTVPLAVPGEVRAIFSGETDAPLFTKLEGLTASARDDGWTRITETAGQKMHRATLGTFPSSAKGEALLHLFRLRAEERYAFRIRLAQADDSQNFLDVLTVLDIPGSYLAETDYGRLAVEVSVDRDRVAHVSVFAKAHADVSSKLQLIALDALNAPSSLHDGASSAGFSMAPFVPAASSAYVAPHGDVGHVVQVAVPPLGTSLFPVGWDASSAILCVHGGFLTGFNAQRFVSLQFPKNSVFCIDGATKDDRANARLLPKRIFEFVEKPRRLRDRLHRSVAVHLSRRIQEGVIVISASGHEITTALASQGKPGKPWDQLRRKVAAQLKRSIQGDGVPFPVVRHPPSPGSGGEISIGASDLRTGSTAILDMRETDLTKAAGFTLLF